MVVQVSFFESARQYMVFIVVRCRSGLFCTVAAEKLTSEIDGDNSNLLFLKIKGVLVL